MIPQKRATGLTWIGAIVLGLAVLTPTSIARLVSVRCCVPRTNDFYFGHVMNGPVSAQQWPGLIQWRPRSCIFGFDDGPHSEQLIDSLCSSDQLPDQSDSYCSEWRDGDAEIVHECRSGGSPSYHQLWDIDGDWDVDLHDFALFQNTFEWPGD